MLNAPKPGEAVTSQATTGISPHKLDCHIGSVASAPGAVSLTHSGSMASCGSSQMVGSCQGALCRTQIARLQARPCTVRQPGRRCAVTPLAAVKEIFMPALSSTMTEGKVVTWLKSPGDKITKGESVVVVESDKADMDVESFTEGFLGGIVIQEGGVANVGG
jgi:acetyl/propionyl-CoA carboxylase alpha subunit